MSTPILPFAVWQSGTNQNSIPANDNSLRNQILNGLVIGVENDAPGGDSDGDIYIVGSSPTGDFAAFDEHDLTIYDSGTWYAFAPVQGICVNIAGTLNQWDGSDYVAVTTGGGGGATSYTIVTEASAFTADPGTHDGLIRYIRAGGNVTFDDTEPYTAGMVFNIRATSAIELLEDGVTLTPPAGGTLELDAAMSVQVVMTSATTADVIGQTVAA